MPDREEGNPLTKREFERLLTRAAQPLDSAPPEPGPSTPETSESHPSGDCTERCTHSGRTEDAEG